MSNQSNRRQFLQDGALAAGVVFASGTISSCRQAADPQIAQAIASNIESIGPLQTEDANGLRLPEGFEARIIAQSGEIVIDNRDEPYVWHGSPDGGATFATDDGGWIYVSNSEMIINGGVGAVRFDKDGQIVDAYSILEGTQMNCAGGPSPWGTWMSCEEHEDGLVWECDPFGVDEPTNWPALGRFKHEAVTFDTDDQRVYLTEDHPEGNFYRFTPDTLQKNGHPDLSAGTLEVAQITDPQTGAVTWHAIDALNTALKAREQNDQATIFTGGEGIWYQNGQVFFTTKGDNRVWKLDVAAQTIVVAYDGNVMTSEPLRGVDNITMTPFGDVLVAEDGDDLQINALTPAGNIVTLLQVMGQDASELAGPAFSPDGTRLYFSSQRGPTGDPLAGGVTYEVTGPFLQFEEAKT